MKKLQISLYALMVGCMLGMGSHAVWAEEAPVGSGTTTGTGGLTWYDESKGLLDWTKSVDDPALGGDQLIGARYETVQQAYADPTGEATSASGRKALRKKTQDLANSIWDFRQYKNEWQQLEDDLQEKVAEGEDLVQRIKNLEEYRSEKQKELDDLRATDPEGRRDAAWAAIRELCPDCRADDIGDLLQRFRPANASQVNQMYHTALNKWLGAKDDIERKIPQLQSDITEMDTNHGKLTAELEKTDAAIDALHRSIQDKENGFDDFKKETRAKVREVTASMTSAEKNELYRTLRDVKPADVYSPDSAVQAKAQQRLNRLAEIYGIDKTAFDLSTNSGRDISVTFLRALDEKVK